MKKLVIIGLLLASVVALTTGAAMAKVINSSVVEFLDPADIGQDELFNECTEELILLTGTFQVVNHINIDKKGVAHIIYHVNPQHMVAIGKMTDDIYLPVGQGTTHANVVGGFPIQLTFTNNVIFVCPGTGVSMLFKITEHLTVNQNGKTTVDFFNLKLECGPGG